MRKDFSEACERLPDISYNKSLSLPLSREDKIDKLLSLFDSIEEIGGYTVIKFNKKVIFASSEDIAILSKKNVMFKTVDGAVFLN
jgi:hypothetical protein